MKITHLQLKEMVKEAIDTVLNKDIVKFSAQDMEELHRTGQIEKGDRVYQYQAPVQEGKLSEEKGGKKPGGKHLVYILTKELKKAQKVLKQGGFKDGRDYTIQPNPGTKLTMGVLMNGKILNKVLEKFLSSRINVYENKNKR